MTYPARQMPWDASSGKLPDPSGLLGWCLLPAIPGSAAMARAYVRISLRQQTGDFPDADAAESIIGELVANALQHAYHDKPSLEDTVLLALCDVPQGLMVLTADQSDDAPTPRPPRCFCRMGTLIAAGSPTPRSRARTPAHRWPVCAAPRPMTQPSSMLISLRHSRPPTKSAQTAPATLLPRRLFDLGRLITAITVRALHESISLRDNTCYCDEWGLRGSSDRAVGDRTAGRSGGGPAGVVGEVSGDRTSGWGEAPLAPVRPWRAGDGFGTAG